MKNTVFTKFHEESGARMVPFAGYNMPVEYFGINEEHITVRKKVGVFDVSHMGEFWVTGQKALPFLQYLTSNDVHALIDGKIQYSCFPTGREELWMIYWCTDSARINTCLWSMQQIFEKDWNWCVRNAENFGSVGRFRSGKRF